MRQQILLVFCLLISLSLPAQKETTVYFLFDNYQLTTEAQKTLDSVIINDNIISVELYGHCDQLGTKEYNYKLSEKRANAVRAYLIEKGLDNTIIKTIKANGEDFPVIDKLDEASRQANRRVIIISLYKSKTLDTVNPLKVAPVKDLPPVIKSPVSTDTSNQELVKKIVDPKTKVGEKIILKNINFHGGSHQFLTGAFPALQDLYVAMQKIPSLVIEIQGHICCRDDESDGWDYDSGEPFLSLNRARAVYEFLLRRGIEKSRMTYKGFGHKYPIFKRENTEDERTANRRVEIKIISK